MEIQIELELMPVREGWLARAPSLRLAAVGISESAATESLCRLVAAHCGILSREGWLEAALKRAKVNVRETGDAELVVKQAA